MLELLYTQAKLVLDARLVMAPFVDHYAGLSLIVSNKLFFFFFVLSAESYHFPIFVIRSSFWHFV